MSYHTVELKFRNFPADKLLEMINKLKLTKEKRRAKKTADKAIQRRRHR